MNTITDEERARRIALVLAEEAGQPLRYVWMSFADPHKPEGEQFLGATVVEACGMGHATQLAHKLGINPGGEVMMAEFGEGDLPDADLNFMFEKLRSKAEMAERGII